MKYIIQQGIFEKKSSLLSGRLALSTPTLDYTYAEIGDTVAAISGYINHCTNIQKGRKVAVIHERREVALLIMLALLQLQAEVILIDSELSVESIKYIFAMELPDVMIQGTDKKISGLPCQELHICISEIRNHAPYKNIVTTAEVMDSLKIHLYANNGLPSTLMDKKTLENVLELTGKTIGSLPSDRYLILGEICFAAFVKETLWCLFNGVHVICYPNGNTVINELLPCATQFPMDFTLFFFGSAKDNPGEEGCYDLLMECVKHADQFDYAGIWTPERHFNEFGGKYPNPSVLSAAIAAITSKIQIRTGSIVAPLHHVVRIAEDWSVIDNLSGGRTAISFASGWQCNDFIFYPERYSVRHETMLEQIAQFRKLWAGERLEFNNGAGKPVQIGIYPRPVQQEMPIWITVSGKIETFIDAGKIGANILTHLLWQDPTDLIKKIQAYRDSLKDNGYSPASGKVTVMLHTYVGKTQEEVRKAVEKPLKEYIRSSLHLVEAMTKTVKSTGLNNAIGRYGRNDEEMPEDLKKELLDFAFERFLAGTSLLGDQAHCTEILTMLRSYGVDELACLIDFGLENATILKGLNELRKLKDRYHPAAQKKYSGNFILRASQNTLLQLIESRPQDIDLCRKIVTEPGNDTTGILAFNNQEEFLIQYQSAEKQPSLAHSIC